jgi:hypothetical protein
MAMPHQARTTEAPQAGAPSSSDQRFRDQGEPAEGEADGDATTLAFDGRMKVSGEDGFSGDPYNRTGSFKRANR